MGDKRLPVAAASDAAAAKIKTGKQNGRAIKAANAPFLPDNAETKTASKLNTMLPKAIAAVKVHNAACCASKATSGHNKVKGAPV